MAKTYLVKNLTKSEIKNIAFGLKNGKIGVIPTDTLYGIHTSAFQKQSIEKIYQIRNRSSDKPFIILIASLDDLEKFGIKITDDQSQFLSSVWPNPLSVVLPISDPNLTYLHRGKNSLAFRMPKNDFLLALLKISGPLVSTSVNLEGEPPSLTIKEAEKYLSDAVDFYLDIGKLNNPASTVITFNHGQTEILRQGSFKL